MELHMINIIYAALPMREQTEKTTSAKLYTYNGVRDLYINEAHMALDIFRFAAFFIKRGMIKIQIHLATYNQYLKF